MILKIKIHLLSLFWVLASVSVDAASLPIHVGECRRKVGLNGSVLYKLKVWTCSFDGQKISIHSEQPEFRKSIGEWIGIYRDNRCWSERDAYRAEINAFREKNPALYLDCLREAGF